jgi:putative endonuclease
MKQPAIYIFSNDSNTVIYIDVTSLLCQRVFQHKQKLTENFNNVSVVTWF